ncbi:MAG: UDP-N-acetylmuramate dehydrogenase [Treponema sp.]|nr:UDP-N-acetylmuramate dehydrogenase [Treponema sp.]
MQVLHNHDAFKGKISRDEPLAPKTTFKVGGNADLFIAPENYYSFQIAIESLLKFQIPFFILGGGSNIVMNDEGVKGAVISTQAFNDAEIFPAGDCPKEFGKIELDKNQVLVTCFSGTPMASLVNFCTDKNFSGLEQFAGLPGTVGGAVYMNARCFEKSISDILFSVSYMDYSEGKVTLKKDRYNPSDWAYKKSPYQNNKTFITTATFILIRKKESEKPLIQNECKKYINERVSKGHFKYPSAGSVFKNNHAFGKPSGQIIDEAGLKGYQIGGAKIADFHGNFIINFNKASSKDIEQLVNHTIETVQKKFGFVLEPEIIFSDKLL